MKSFYHTIYIVFIFVTACSSNRKEFYSSGELKKELIYKHSHDTSTYLEKTYFPCGQLKTFGNYVNGKREGVWQGWFADGDNHWEAEYIQGIPKPPPEDPFIKIDIIGEYDGNWYANTPQYLRIYVEGATYDNATVLCSNTTFELPSDTTDYNFNVIVIPKNPGKMYFHVIYRNENGKIFSLGVDTIFVQPKPLIELK